MALCCGKQMYVVIRFAITICSFSVTVAKTRATAYLPLPADDVKYLGASNPTDGLYAHGAVAVYKCEGSGFGYISLSCLGNNVWGSQTRNVKVGKILFTVRVFRKRTKLALVPTL